MSTTVREPPCRHPTVSAGRKAGKGVRATCPGRGGGQSHGWSGPPTSRLLHGIGKAAHLTATRGLLREFGYTIPVGARHVVPRTWALLEDTGVGIPDPLRVALAEACLEIRDLEQRVSAVEKQLGLLAKDLPVVERLLTIPGIGLLTGTALVAFVGDVQRFPTGRHFGCWAGHDPAVAQDAVRGRVTAARGARGGSDASRAAGGVGGAGHPKKRLIRQMRG